MGRSENVHAGAPTEAQRRYLRRGLKQPGGKLPLFDEFGSEINPKTIRSCIRHGWVEPWFNNPIEPNWLVCKLTESGRTAAQDARAKGLVNLNKGKNHLRLVSTTSEY